MTSDSQPSPSELSALWTLSWPAVVGQLGWMAMGVVDVIMVGQLGEVSLAAVSAGHIWSFGVLIFAMGILNGLDPFFAQSHGAGDQREQGHALARAILLAGLLAIPATLLHFWAAPALTLLGQPADIIDEAAGYSEAVALGCPGILIFTALRQFLQGGGWMREPMIAVWIANVGNVALNYGLIYGNWGLPELGVAGCGWATSIVRVAMIFVLLALAHSKLFGRPVPSTRELWSWAPLRRLLRIGVPVGAHFGMEVWAFSTVGLFMGMLGTQELAAHSVVMTIISVTFMIPFGISAAAATRVGQLVGARAAWARAAWTAMAIGAGWMGVMALVLIAIPEPLIRIFISDNEVVQTGLLLVPLAATFQLFDGIQTVAAGTLRGAGDTLIPALIIFTGFWCLCIPLAWTLGVSGAGDGWVSAPIGVWSGLVVGLIFVALAQAARMMYVIRRGANRVIESE